MGLHCVTPVVDPVWGGKGPCPPISPPLACKNSYEKMGVERGGLYVMFLPPPPRQVSGSTTVHRG